jgi:hypothetical protein
MHATAYPEDSFDKQSGSVSGLGYMFMGKTRNVERAGAVLFSAHSDPAQGKA